MTATKDKPDPPTDAEMAEWMGLCEEANGPHFQADYVRAARKALPRLIAEVRRLTADFARHESAMKLIGEAAALLEKDKGLVASLAALRDERDAARADWRQCAEALVDIPALLEQCLQRPACVGAELLVKELRALAAVLAIAERHAKEE